jgi:cytochrome c5
VQQYCAACHMTGAAGAPKIGDKAAWAKRIGAGLDQMLKTAVAGKGAMPARGGAADLSDQELAGAIVHMANQSGGKLKEPAAPKGVAASAERSGEQVVQAACIRCHETGASGAPKIGDKTAWSPRISQGVDAITKSAIRGHGNMPARGGLADLTDREVTNAILYMFGRAGSDGAANKAAGK